MQPAEGTVVEPIGAVFTNYETNAAANVIETVATVGIAADKALAFG